MDELDVIKKLKYSIFLRIKELMILHSKLTCDEFRVLPDGKRLYYAIDVIDEIISY